MSSTVLDSSAYLAFLDNEPGSDTVAAAIIEGSIIGSVNVCEIVTKLTERGVDHAEIDHMLGDFPLRIVPFELEHAVDAGLLRANTRSAGLSLGDRACLALARQLGLPALTTDRNWQNVSIGVEIQLIR